MFGFGRTKKIEEEMAEWLAHPNEFGVRPKSVRHKRTYQASLIHGDAEIHLCEYVMPDGTCGRGFVNGSLTWSFLGEGVEAIDDDNLLLAYCGWAWLFPAIQSGGVVTDFVSEGEEARYLAQKEAQGLTDVEITGRYLIGTSELFEFVGSYQGTAARGAGDTGDEVGFMAGDPCFNLPAIYFFLGRQVIKAMR